MIKYVVASNHFILFKLKTLSDLKNIYSILRCSLNPNMSVELHIVVIFLR